MKKIHRNIRLIKSPRCKIRKIVKYIAAAAGVFLFIRIAFPHNSLFEAVSTSAAIANIINPQIFIDCEDLYVKTSFQNFNFSAEFWKNHDAFQSALRLAIINQSIEGNSGQYRKEQLTLHYLAGLPFVRSICETGFNMGHSSYTFLTAGNATVHSFDLGRHQYAHTMGDFMKKQFPGRFVIHFGDSEKTVPQFIKDNPGFICDFIYVDGGHWFNWANADILNFGSIANMAGNVVILDDYPCTPTICSSIGPAWENALRNGLIKEHMRCMFKKSGYSRGFTVGQFISNRTRN